MNLRRVLAGSVLSAGLLLSSCSTDTDSGDGSLEVDDPWGRPTAPGAVNAAFYLDLRNGTTVDHELTGATAAPCERTEIHMSSMSDGVMSMAQATSEERSVAAGEDLSLAPGGLHVMCMGLSEPLVAGDSVAVSLHFVDHDDIVVDALIEQR